MLTGLLAVSFQAFAVVIVAPATCQSLGIQNNVSDSRACQFGSTSDDTLGSPNQVNTDHMFGYTNWIFDGENVETRLWTFGSKQVGFWFLDDNVWDASADVMLVLKAGNGETVPNTYVGYLLEQGQQWGKYLSPFMNGRDRRDLSHISLYVRDGDGTSVPEPTTLALIGLGLLGLAYMRRRKT